MLSVNGKGGTVRLNALDVWALPRPVSPKAGQLVRVVKVDASTGALTADTISTDSLSGLGSEEKALLLKLLGSASYTDSSARDDLEALKKLWDTTPPTPLPDPDIVPVEKVTLSQHTLELSRGSTADLSASIAPRMPPTRRYCGAFRRRTSSRWMRAASLPSRRVLPSSLPPPTARATAAPSR